MAFAFEMPFERRTWDWVAKYSKSAEVAYWKETAAAGGWRPPQEDAMYAVEQLQKAGRAWAALDLIAMLLFEKKSIESAVLCNALDAILSVGADDKQKSAMDLHNVTQTFEVLQERNDVDVPRLARLEFAFSPMLHRYTLLPRTLHRELATNPSFFVGCLTTLYRPRSARGDSTPPADPDGSKAEKARRIWRLLYDWQTIPGSDEHGQIDEKQLQSWLSAARNLAKDADRLELCDTHIGQVFANSDVDPTDGSIPAIAIRDVIEQLESENLERGYAIGLHNLRGTSTKGIYEGGKQERDIAAVFNRYADACVSWPRTASILRGVAGDYLREAVEEDERARARE